MCLHFGGTPFSVRGASAEVETEMRQHLSISPQDEGSLGRGYDRTSGRSRRVQKKEYVKAKQTALGDRLVDCDPPRGVFTGEQLSHIIRQGQSDRFRITIAELFFRNEDFWQVVEG